jgi:hypothetical protein
MPIRPQIQRLCHGLLSSDDETVISAITRAALLFKQSELIDSARFLSRHHGDELEHGYLRRRLKEIRDEFGVLADHRLLSLEDVGLSLRLEERRAVTHGLVDLLSRDLQIARQAADALGGCRQLSAVQPLLKMARGAVVGADASIAETAIRSLATILTTAVPPDRPPAPGEERTISGAAAALDSLADDSGAAHAVRTAARLALALIRRRYKRRMSR